MLLKNSDTVFIWDEASELAHAYTWAHTAQKMLMQAVERARFRKNMILACTRDPTKVDMALRAKASTALFLLDRPRERGAFGVVLYQHGFFSNPDQFNIEGLSRIFSISGFLEVCEHMPNFLGYYISDEEIGWDVQSYLKEKEGAADQLAIRLEKMARQEEMRQERLLNGTTRGRGRPKKEVMPDD